MKAIYARVGDVGKTLAVTLRDDPSDAYPSGVPATITGATVTLHMREVSSGATIDVTGLVGEAAGVCPTPIPTASLVQGVWRMQWKVAGGLTYPEDITRCPIMVVGPEVA